MKKFIIFFTIAIGFVACDKDKFADINQDPTQINSPDLTYLFTQALNKLDDNYTEWFYDNSQYSLPWTQTTVGSTGNTGDVVLDKEHGNRSSLFYSDILPILAEIRYFVDSRYIGKEQAAYQYIKYMTYPLQIIQAMKITDMYGSMAYTQAGMAKYTNPPLLKPVLDDQETLFITWNQELKKSVEVLSSEVIYDGENVNQVSLGGQDFVYGGDASSWAKFANSLRLRIAARLLNSNKTLALQIAEEVASNTAGVMNDIEDDFYWSPSPEYFHFQNDIWFGVGGKNLVDFLRDNEDPRLRFIFSKNDFNSKVIQAFFNEGKDLPSYILNNVDFHTEATADGDIKIFDGWKGQGEPWVRYYGAPAAPDAKQNTTLNNDYFLTENFKIGSKTYSPTSYYNEKNIVSNIDETYPDAPGITNIHTANAQYHSLLFSAAETQLFLAEFKLQGANLSGSANDYFQKAVELSVTSMNKLAGDNDILYYSQVYDSNEETVALKSGELDALKSRSAYQLTGNTNEDLEKVYIQQYLNYLNLPNEVFVTVRRSGFPKTSSTILAREAFTDGGVELVVPRRFTISTPTADDINYQNKLNAINDQGFTAGNSDPVILHDERIWYDKNASDWGKGLNK